MASLSSPLQVGDNLQFQAASRDLRNPSRNERCRMKKTLAEDRRLVRLTKICLALPETTRWYNGQHAGFLVRKKTFAYFLNDHHGDGIIALNCKVLPGDNKSLASAQPTRFYFRTISLREAGPDCAWTLARSTGTKLRNLSAAAISSSHPSAWQRS